MPSDEEAARVVLIVLNLATNRQPIHMDIGDGHKDGYLHHLLLDILILIDHLGDNNTTIAR